MKEILILLTILSALLLIGSLQAQPEITYSIQYSGVGTVTSSVDNPYEVEGIVTNVVDGDTIDVNITIGDNRVSPYQTIRVRLADVDAPETRGPNASLAGKLSKEYTNIQLFNQTIWLDLDNKTGKDIYNRWVAVVYLNGQNFNKELITSGHAEIDDYKNNEFDPTQW